MAPKTMTTGSARSLPGIASGWSAWQPLHLQATMTGPVLAETLDGGQAFRWQPQPEGGWHGFFGQCVVRLFLASDDTLHWSAPAANAASTRTALQQYLDAERDPRALADALPWRSDAHLARCLAAFPGLRILRQPFGETLLGFLCSATKQIVQIKQMLALLAERHGAPVADSMAAHGGQRAAIPIAGPGSVPGAPLHRLPTWPELARISESDLRACLLGFRARYIHQTAQFLAERPEWLEQTESLPYGAAKERLCSLPGVGEKVADCVLLFGANRLEAFPVDVWILKAMADRYGLAGWKPAQIAHFGRVHFGPLAGLAQQYLFAYERQMARAKRQP